MCRRVGAATLSLAAMGRTRKLSVPVGEMEKSGSPEGTHVQCETGSPGSPPHLSRPGAQPMAQPGTQPAEVDALPVKSPVGLLARRRRRLLDRHGGGPRAGRGAVWISRLPPLPPILFPPGAAWRGSRVEREEEERLRERAVRTLGPAKSRRGKLLSAARKYACVCPPSAPRLTAPPRDGSGTQIRFTMISLELDSNLVERLHYFIKKLFLSR